MDSKYPKPNRRYCESQNSVSYTIWTSTGGGLLHREDGPAWIFYYEYPKSISLECYHINNKKHREDGPAYIAYNKDGSIEEHKYYLNDIQVEKLDVIAPRLNKILKSHDLIIDSNYIIKDVFGNIIVRSSEKTLEKDISELIDKVAYF